MEAVQAIQQILDEVNQAKDARQTSPDFARFIHTLAAASGNSPVAAFCRFLAGVQISLETELSGDSVEAWRRTSSRLAKIPATACRCHGRGQPTAAHEAAKTYHERALTTITALPNASATVFDDSTLSTFVARCYATCPN